jgi:hypothetical protein
MRTLVIRIAENNVACCDELSMASSGDTPEEAVKKLTTSIRNSLNEPVIFSLPYLGSSFDMHWHSIKKKPDESVDEFEAIQKRYEFREDANGYCKL